MRPSKTAHVLLVRVKEGWQRREFAMGEGVVSGRGQKRRGKEAKGAIQEWGEKPGWEGRDGKEGEAGGATSMSM